jgi:hypothetical protein
MESVRDQCCCARVRFRIRETARPMPLCAIALFNARFPRLALMDLRSASLDAVVIHLAKSHANSNNRKKHARVSREFPGTTRVGGRKMLRAELIRQVHPAYYARLTLHLITRLERQLGVIYDSAVAHKNAYSIPQANRAK